MLANRQQRGDPKRTIEIQMGDRFCGEGISETAAEQLELPISGAPGDVPAKVTTPKDRKL